MIDDNDNISDMERPDTKSRLPIGWVALFLGLILWGMYYMYAYNPVTTGWTQEKEYTESIQK